MSRWANVEGRFWSKVDKRGPDECWEWTASVGSHGYGQIYGSGRRWTTHRFSWELHNGPVTDGDACVLHRCDNRRCVNPAHLFLGTHADNTQDCVRKGRFAVGEANGSAKLDAADVSLMRFLRSIGARNKDLADWFGVSNSAASLVGLGKNWSRC